MVHGGGLARLTDKSYINFPAAARDIKKICKPILPASLRIHFRVPLTLFFPRQRLAPFFSPTSPSPPPLSSLFFLSSAASTYFVFFTSPGNTRASPFARNPPPPIHVNRTFSVTQLGQQSMSHWNLFGG